MDNISQMSIKQYIDVLSSKSSMPGGGTTSALNATMGVSLFLMVINISLEKDKYDKEELNKYKTELETLNTSLFDLIDKDVEAYENMINYYNMPANTEEEKKIKNEKKQEALSICVNPPMQVMQFSIAAMDYAIKLLGNTQKSVESDLIIGAINLRSAINSAYQNVIINTKYMNDKEVANSINSFAKDLVDKSKVITHMINDKIKG